MASETVTEFPVPPLLKLRLLVRLPSQVQRVVSLRNPAARDEQRKGIEDRCEQRHNQQPRSGFTLEVLKGDVEGEEEQQDDHRERARIPDARNECESPSEGRLVSVHRLRACFLPRAVASMPWNVYGAVPTPFHRFTS